MLVLTRRPGDRVIIETGAERIEVVCCEVGRGQVKLGFIAPESVSVDREEIWLKKRLDKGSPES